MSDYSGREAPPQMPSRRIYLLAFLGVVLGGIFGGIIGFGLARTGCTGDCQAEQLLGMIMGASLAAIGTGIVAVLALRAVSEWNVKTR